MQFENETQLIFKGEERQSLWGYQNPDFDGTDLQVTLDALVMPESLVPFRYAEGKDSWMMDKGSSSACMTYVFKLGGPFSPERLDQQMRIIGAFTHALPHDWSEYHTSHRVFEGSEKGSIRTFVYRVHRNVKDQCQGHPEMLCGAPLGMHHCDCCGEMVMAGLPHPGIEHYMEFHDACEQDDLKRERDEWFPKVWAGVESEYVAYGKLKEGWYDDLPPPLPESLKLAREFFEYVRENLTVFSRERVLPSLDHEGYVGLLMPNDETMPSWWSCSFYPDETVTYSHEKGKDEHGKVVKIPQGPDHNAQLLALIHKL
uniref:Uncharacterized protein n=1 Tax=Pseudomonas phage HRDY3 TaxID=3236930 RepID=A0AB39CDK4_9VIRU